MNSPVSQYSHEHDTPINVNKEYKEQLTVGQKCADKVAEIVGSWTFLIVQTAFLCLWIAMNAYLMLHPNEFVTAWDVYPFILMNLMLSLEAAYTAPIIMMSQNRQATKDRLTAESDYDVDQRSERELKVVMEEMKYLEELIKGAQNGANGK